MWVVKIGGPAYRIGMGGGAASSMVQGENVEELDFNAVQRGDAEMEQKVNRVIRACVELGDRNPIVSIHDQGAGGNCNVLKEIVEPAGARIEIREIPLGDDTLSVLEIWGAEYQENDALLLRPEHADLFRAFCEREKVTYAFVGRITGDGKIRSGPEGRAGRHAAEDVRVRAHSAEARAAEAARGAQRESRSRSSYAPAGRGV
jgi:phosphoribosylformylglycinamidine synthase